MHWQMPQEKSHWLSTWQASVDSLRNTNSSKRFRSNTRHKASQSLEFHATSSWVKSPEHQKKFKRSAAPHTELLPLTEKIDVNGDARHALYSALTPVADAEGVDGDIRWNFEKFLVNRDGAVVARFHPKTAPDAPEVISAIESAL